MKKIIAFILLILGVVLLGLAIYFALQPTAQKSISDLFKIIGSLSGGILAAGTGIKDWVELLKDGKEPKPETRIEISGDSPQISTGENSRNVQTAGGNYVEKLEISLSIQDNSFERAVTRKTTTRKLENITPFLIGVVLDLSSAAFDSIYQLSQQDESFFERLVKALNTFVNKAISYCEHPHSKDILPKFSLFFYGFGFGKALKGLDSIASRLLGIEPDDDISIEPIRDLLRLTADDKELPRTPNAAELNRYWKTYRSDIIAQYVDMDFNDAPLVQTLAIVRERFMNEQTDKKYQPMLLLITNGKFTDGTYSDLLKVADTIKSDGVTLVIGFVGKNDIMPTRRLLSKEQPKWDLETKTLFQCSSELDKSSRIGKALAEMAIEKSWQVPEKPKLFLQVNQQEMLDELIDLITSPLRD